MSVIKGEKEFGYKSTDINYGVHVIFSTIPNQKDSNFEEDVEKHYFENYRKDVKSDLDKPYLYKPLKFYMLGDYDVCYLSLINNFKFSHRLFEPKSQSPDRVYNSHTFQSYSGYALNQEKHLVDLFSLDIEKEHPISYFVGIIHLKLNNGLYIGNGLAFIEKVNLFLTKKLGILNVPFVLNQTFTWFELSLVVFINDPKILSQILFELRQYKFEDLINEFKDEDNIIDLKKDSLYYEILENDKVENSVNGKTEEALLKENKEIEDKIFKTSLFADTNSHFGINERLINNHFTDDNCSESNKTVDEYVVKFIEDAKKINLKTEIEWQVKPGHVKQIVDLLIEHPFLGEYFSQSDIRTSEVNTSSESKKVKTNMVLGKCDYLIQENNTSILSNFHLIRDLHFKRKEKCDFFKHARKVRTYIFLETEQVNSISSGNNEPISWERTLSKLAVSSGDFSTCDDNLKSLKVSRQLRTKILKIFSNYNNGILDPILFPYFLDFKVFIDNLKELIEYYYLKSKKEIFPLQILEIDLNKHISTFEEGYIVRFLNGYQFENISDFDLDFNNSIQQLLSSYGTMIYEYGRLFYKDKYYPILQLNDTDTVSDYLAIHYFGHHLTSPEFIFASLTKEILNHVKFDNDDYKKLLEDYEKTLPSIKADINESYFDEMIENNLISIDYFVIDAIRYKLTYNSSFETYEHWFWSYHFQNSHNFNSNGSFNEHRLKMELFRLLLIYRTYVLPNKEKKIAVNKALGIDVDVDLDLKCPSPEIFTYWDRHYKKIDIIVKNIIEFSKKGNIDNVLYKIFLIVEDIFKYTDIKEKDGLPIKTFNYLSNDLLQNHYLSNNKELTALKRSWKDGTILENHKDLYKNIYYAIDGTGGVFFYDSDGMQKYFIDNAKYLLSIIDFASINKKDFIKKHIS